MKKIFLTLVAISISILTFSQGVIWNDAIAKGFAESATRLEATRAISPSSFSLERYVPQVYDQGETNKDGAASPTLPQYSGDSLNERTIQDLLFLENRDRKYDADINRIYFIRSD